MLLKTILKNEVSIRNSSLVCSDYLQVVRMDEKQNIIELSKEYSIVTQFTSFIAVEKRDKVGI